MVVYTVHYTLSEPEQNYEELHDAIESLGDTCHIMDAMWLVRVDANKMGPTDIRSELKQHVSKNDKLFVMKKSTAGVTWASNFHNQCTSWLKEQQPARH